MRTEDTAYNITSERTERRRCPKRRLFLSGMALFFLIVIIGVKLNCFSVESDAIDVRTSYKYYTSVQVQDGDSLWSIADQYLTSEYCSHETYVQELIAINHLSDTTIHAGKYLTVPYFSSEYK